jgi:hypothetical protein
VCGTRVLIKDQEPKKKGEQPVLKGTMGCCFGKQNDRAGAYRLEVRRLVLTRRVVRKNWGGRCRVWLGGEASLQCDRPQPKGPLGRAGQSTIAV